MPAGLDGNPDPIRSPARDAVLAGVAGDVLRRGAPGEPIAIGIDGAAGTGKSTFADELGRVLASVGRPVIRSTTDSFHNPRAARYRRGRASAKGYFLDSHDLHALRALLLDPFREGRPFVTAAFDEPSDTALTAVARAPQPDSVLVFDGLFLHRSELLASWSYSILLQAPRRTARARSEAAERASATAHRYSGGWQLYVDECRPEARADCVIDNDDFAAPRILRRPPGVGVLG